MTLERKQKILATLNTGLGYGFNKRFVANMKNADPNKITEKQKEWIDKILYKYRRQFVAKDFKALLNAPEKDFIAYINNNYGQEYKTQTI